MVSKEFQLTPQIYFRILILKYVKKRFIFYIFLWVATIAIATISMNLITIFLIFYSVFYPLFIIFYYYRFARTKANKIIFLKRHIEIAADKMIVHIEDGTKSEILLSNIIQVIRYKSYSLIYISKNQFVYIPLTAFHSVDEFATFHKKLTP